ncbi:GyrI-like domain-containing protein [Kaarinaea lacus]
MNIVEKAVTTTRVIGIKTSTSSTLESDPESARIPELWQRFFSENIEEHIPDKMSEGLIYGVYSDYDNEHRGNFSFIAGRQVLSTELIPEDFAAIEIPQGDYLVFSDDGDMPAVIYSMWQTIREYFSQSANHHRAFTTDFELYNNEHPNKIEIYIALKK